MQNPSSIKLQLVILFITALFSFWLGSAFQMKKARLQVVQVTRTEFIPGSPDTVRVSSETPGRGIIKPAGRQLDTTVVDEHAGLRIRVHSRDVLDSIAVDYTVKTVETLITRVDTVRIMDTVYVSQPAQLEDPEWYESFYGGLGIGIILGLVLLASD